MNPNELRRRLMAQPFRPFRIHLSDGGHLDVYHPEQVIPIRNTAIVGTRTAAGAMTDDATTISLLHVTRLEPIER